MRFLSRLIQAAMLCTLALGGNRAFAGDLTIPVKITNTPVPVTVTNPTTSVQVNNTAPIAVTATTALPVRQATQPFQYQFALDWPDFQAGSTVSYVVQPGKLLVIEYASLSALLQPEGQTLMIRIVTTVNGSDAFHTLAVQKQEDLGLQKQFTAAHLVRIYADPGSTIQITAIRNPFNSTANCFLTLSGHFEDVP